MDMNGEFRIPAPREAVWKALNDPEILKQCIPGCEELTKNSDTEFVARVVAKVGPVKAGFSGKVTLSALDPPNGYKISGEGQGGAAGFAKGGADVRLESDGSGTLLKYTVNAAIGGKLAQIGARLIDGSARKMAEDFFTKFGELVAAQQPTGAAPAMTTASVAPDSSDVVAPESSLDEDPPPAPAPHAAPAEMKPDIDTGGHGSGGLKPWIWVSALILIAIGLLVIYG
jgi:carbon monoxide dehydrogenase subunit G